MRIISYTVACDRGFAPNPFWGYCTLACCKPTIRRVADVGDWIVGLEPGGQRVLYIMQVTEKLSFRQYWHDLRFAGKRPDMEGDAIARVGDNLYRPSEEGFEQIRSRHSLDDGTEDTSSKAHDLKGRFVLVSNRFAYHGQDAIELPEDLVFLRIGRGHRSRFSDEQIAAVDKWARGRCVGKVGYPWKWPVRELESAADDTKKVGCD
jgi:hypothetical protein